MNDRDVAGRSRILAFLADRVPEGKNLMLEKYPGKSSRPEGNHETTKLGFV